MYKPTAYFGIVFVLTNSYFSAQAAQEARVQITIETTDTSNIIRRDIGRQTFGSGLQSTASQLRWTMEPLTGSEGTISSATSDTIRWLNLGSFRFPNGDSSFLYDAALPQFSYDCKKIVENDQKQVVCNSHEGPWNAYLTRDEIVKYTESEKLNPNSQKMERLFQVNATSWVNYNNGARSYVKEYPCSNCLPYINPVNLDATVRNAVEWLDYDQTHNLQNDRTVFWEVGNEEWARQSAAEHAQVFDAFQQGMFKRRSDIKLLAQGLAAPVKYPEGENKPEEWLTRLKDKLQSSDGVNGSNGLKSVYAYSVHEYLSGNDYGNSGLTPLEIRKRQTSDMFAQIEAGTAIGTLRDLIDRKFADTPVRDWKLWVTEFNVDQIQKNASGVTEHVALQDMGHALIIADWTGKMLSQNVERMFMHSLDDSPAWALVQYTHDGASIWKPKVNIPGHAFAKYAQEFGKTMVKNHTENNPPLYTPDGTKSYPQVSVYSSVSADNMSLRVMVINRNLEDKVRVDIDTVNVANRRWLADGKFTFQQLFPKVDITDSNRIQTAEKEYITWTSPINLDQTVTGIKYIPLAPASVNFFVIPLQP